MDKASISLASLPTAPILYSNAKSYSYDARVTVGPLSGHCLVTSLFALSTARDRGFLEDRRWGSWQAAQSALARRCTVLHLRCTAMHHSQP